MGAVRSPFAGNGGIVPDRKGQRARIAKRHLRDPDGNLPLSRHQSSYDGQRTMHHRGRGLSHPRHRPRGRRKDHSEMEPVRRPGVDAVGGDEIAGAGGQYGAVHVERRASARQRRASILQPVVQISAHRCLGDRRTSGLSVEDLWRHLARREPGHVAAELLAFRHVC